MSKLASGLDTYNFDDNGDLVPIMKEDILRWHCDFIMGSGGADWESSTVEIEPESKDEQGIVFVSRKYPDLALVWVVNVVSHEIRNVQLRPTWQCDDVNVANYVAAFRGELIFTGKGVERLREHLLSF